MMVPSPPNVEGNSSRPSFSLLNICSFDVVSFVPHFYSSLYFSSKTLSPVVSSPQPLNLSPHNALNLFPFYVATGDLSSLSSSSSLISSERRLYDDVLYKLYCRPVIPQWGGISWGLGHIFISSRDNHC